MPRHYEDGRLFRLRSHPTEGPELCFRLTEEELDALRQVDQKTITTRDRAIISDLISLISKNDDEVIERVNRRFARVAAEGPAAHNAQTTQDALPNRKKWTDRLDDIYNIYRNAGIVGMTDQEAQDAYSNLKRIDRRDIGDIVRPARVALVKIGLIYNTGKTKEVRSGNQATLWAAVDPAWRPPERNEYMTKEQIIKLLERNTEHGRYRSIRFEFYWPRGQGTHQHNYEII